MPGCSTSLDLGYNDAGVQYDAECKPGTYVGGFSCTATSTSIFAGMGGMGDGSITVTLVPAGSDTLTLAPDAALLSNLTGATSTTALSGVLDCSKRTLTGVASHVQFYSPTFTGMLTGMGAFTAVYDADASPPALVNGVLDAPPSLGATCAWSATLE
jgi:hypothetical protein